MRPSVLSLAKRIISIRRAQMKLIRLKTVLATMQVGLLRCGEGVVFSYLDCLMGKKFMILKGSGRLVME